MRKSATAPPQLWFWPGNWPSAYLTHLRVEKFLFWNPRFFRELLKQAKNFVEEGMHSQIIIRGFRRACQLAKDKILELAVPITLSDPVYEIPLVICFRLLTLFYSLVRSGRCSRSSPAQLWILSWLLHTRICFRKWLLMRFWRSITLSTSATLAWRRRGSSFAFFFTSYKFFSFLSLFIIFSLAKSFADLVLSNNHSCSGGSLDETLLIQGVAFKKSFSYAGFEQQPKKFKDAKVSTYFYARARKQRRSTVIIICVQSNP